MAVCVLPGTELAFSQRGDNKQFPLSQRLRGGNLSYATAIFRQVNKTEPWMHHDALEFPDGLIALLTKLSEGQGATVLQLPAQPTTAAEADTKKRIAYVG